MTPTTAELTPLAGGWRPVTPIPHETTLLLERALATESNYREGVTARVSILEIRSLTQQVVSGTNYRFEVVASASNVTDPSHPQALYVITIYSQPWTNTLQVTGIELLAAVTGGVHATKAAGAAHVKHTTTKTTMTSTFVSSSSGKVAGGASTQTPDTGAAAPTQHEKKTPTSFLCSIDSLFF